MISGNSQGFGRVEIAILSPIGIVLVDGTNSSTIWTSNASRRLASAFSYIFNINSTNSPYNDVLICLVETNPRAIRLSGKTGKLLWSYNDSFYYSTRDAFIINITEDEVPELVFCTSNELVAINGSDGISLWELSSPVSDIAISDLNSNGSKIIVGTFLEQLFFIDGKTGQMRQQTVIEENDHSTDIFIEDLKNDDKKEIISPSFGNSLAILDAAGSIQHRVKTRYWASDLLIADVLGSADLEFIADTVTVGWIGVLGHGFSSGVDDFFPLLVISGSLGILGLIGGLFWRLKRFHSNLTTRN